MADGSTVVGTASVIFGSAGTGVVPESGRAVVSWTGTGVDAVSGSSAGGAWVEESDSEVFSAVSDSAGDGVVARSTAGGVSGVPAVAGSSSVRISTLQNWPVQQNENEHVSLFGQSSIDRLLL